MVRIAFFLAGLYTATLTFFSLYKLVPQFEVGGVSITDKMLHASAYFVLFVFWQLAFWLKSKSEIAYKINILIICVSCIAFGMLIELLQGALTTYRQPDWLDIVANSTGVFIASILFLILESQFKKVKSKY